MSEFEPVGPIDQPEELVFTVKISVDPAHRKNIGNEIARRLGALGELAVDGQVEVHEDTWPAEPDYQALRARRREQVAIDKLIAETKLSEREREVGQLVGCGLSNKEVGEILFITSLTVKAHLRRMFNKTGIRNRHQLGAMFHGIHPDRWQEQLAHIKAAAEAQQLPRKF